MNQRARRERLPPDFAIGSSIADDVRRGLTAFPKALPPYLFYDEVGSRLYEQITALPEYYLTRREQAIFDAHARAIVARVEPRSRHRLGVVELGAGSATKTRVLLQAVVERQTHCVYMPIDVSRSAIEEAERRLREDVPGVQVRPFVMTHLEAIRRLRGLEPPQLVLFIGSSVGNFEDVEAAALLRGVRTALGPETTLLLGTDLRKSPAVLLPAYDDAAGVTAAFNKNVLVRINRELGGNFDLDRFRHVARWNDAASQIEMHLESSRVQEVTIAQLGLRVRFDARETIHTESSVKYDLPRVERLLAAGGFALETTYYDGPEKLFALHFARGR